MKTFGISGWSGSGKTTLMEAIIPLIAARGLKVSAIKHAHHNVDVDKPGKDSYRFREAGAGQVLLASDRRWALMCELHGAPEPEFAELVSHLAPCDLVLAEGFKTAELPKIEVYRVALGKPFFHADCPNVLAVASDSDLQIVLPVLNLNAPAQVADFILRQSGLA